jgi:two-component system, NtrC family, response regulator GlrR
MIGESSVQDDPAGRSAVGLLLRRMPTDATHVLRQHGRVVSATFRPYRLRVVAPGGEERTIEVVEPSFRIGSRAGNDLVLDDAAVSRIHCEIAGSDEGYRLRDLGSTNGTFVDGVRANDVHLRGGSTLRLGGHLLTFEPGERRLELPLAASERFGPMVGQSAIMRQLFARIERVATSNATVLVEGESGTGKEVVAEAIHGASPRGAGPFVVFDCAAIPDNLIESELFGHERGAFTGADAARAGALEEADGGTLFLDEIGELPLHLQAKLLRAVERREVRRLGGQRRKQVDVRFVAATNRDLARAVNEGIFREDLYYRLAVVRLVVPPLRDRRDDIPLLLETFAKQVVPDPARAAAVVSSIDERRWRSLAAYRWPGNVRELRNVVERAIALAGDDTQVEMAPPTQEREATEAPPTAAPAPPPSSVPSIDVGLTFHDHRKALLDSFEAAYVRALLDASDGKITRAATRAGIDRTYFKRLMKKHGI